MPSVNTQSLTCLERRPGLVSVDGRTYPLKSANINARAEGGIAATTFTQTYGNPYAEALEVLYTLPLPADGAVTGYTIRLGKRVIRGEVRKRDEAREEYRKALFEGRTAALLEQERADTFSQKLGSLPPGETVMVEIEVLQPLAFLPANKSEHACWEYRFPTVVGVRYEGGEDRVPDAARLDVDRVLEGTPVKLEASLLISDGPASDIRPYAPGQQIDLMADGNGTRIILDKGMSLDRDLVIRWLAGKQEIGVRVVEGKGLPCDSGRYLLITLTPPAAVSNAVSRDLTLLIDASGSMSGEPIEQAKAVASELLHSLNPGDRFEILAFANEVRRVIPGPVDASQKSIAHALHALQKLQASGSTEMTGALIEALKPLRPGSQRQVILLSDGYIGFEREVIAEIRRRLAPGARIHVVGVGSAPNRTLTRGAARAGRGIEILIGLEDDASKAAERLLQATVHPILTNIMVQGSCLVSCAPQKPRDVLAAQPILLFAEIKAKGGSLEISGNTTDRTSPWIRTLEIPELRQLSHDTSCGRKGLCITSLPIGALFGRETIEDAEIDLAADFDKRGNRIEKLIESLGLRHGISSRMTSLIAISEDPTVDPKNPRRRERLPLEVPAGISAEGAGLMPSVRAISPALHALSLHEAAILPAIEDESEALPRLLSWRKAMVSRQPPGSILIDRTQVLHLDGQILIFEFEVPVDGFVLPDEKTKIRVWFDEIEDSCFARVLEDESSKTGPHQAGLTVRLALKLEGTLRWDHDTANIHWRGLLRRERKKSKIDVELRLPLRRDR